MKYLIQTNTGRLRLIGFLEGLSFLLLLGIAMPLKYYAGIKEATLIIGMIHGALFVMYIMLVYPVKVEQSWKVKTTGLALLASIIPFGTFVFDAKVLKGDKMI